MNKKLIVITLFTIAACYIANMQAAQHIAEQPESNIKQNVSENVLSKEFVKVFYNLKNNKNEDILGTAALFDKTYDLQERLKNDSPISATQWQRLLSYKAFQETVLNQLDAFLNFAYQTINKVTLNNLTREMSGKSQHRFIATSWGEHKFLVDRFIKAIQIYPSFTNYLVNIINKQEALPTVSSCKNLAGQIMIHLHKLLNGLENKIQQTRDANLLQMYFRLGQHMQELSQAFFSLELLPFAYDFNTQRKIMDDRYNQIVSQKKLSKKEQKLNDELDQRVQWVKEQVNAEKPNKELIDYYMNMIKELKEKGILVEKIDAHLLELNKLIAQQVKEPAQPAEQQAADPAAEIKEKSEQPNLPSAQPFIDQLTQYENEINNILKEQPIDFQRVNKYLDLILRKRDTVSKKEFFDMSTKNLVSMFNITIRDLGSAIIEARENKPEGNNNQQQQQASPPEQKKPSETSIRESLERYSNWIQRELGQNKPDFVKIQNFIIELQALKNEKVLVPLIDQRILKLGEQIQHKKERRQRGKAVASSLVSQE